MKEKLSVTIFMAIALIFLLSQPSLGVELEKCKDCHGNVKPISPNSLTKDCMSCHGEHGDDYGPQTRDPEYVHWIHSGPRKKSDRKDCQGCHRYAPIECIRCHNSHENIGNVKIGTSTIDMSNTSVCTYCHGALPQPKGHEDFRSSISDSKHKWMNCRTCHLNVYNGINGNGADKATNGTDMHNKNYEFDLHFKDIQIVPMDDSTDLCKICHSPQYKGLKEGSHGEGNKICIDCHNPHTTKFGPMVKITPKEPEINISTRVESATNWITTNVPIVKNTTALYVIIIIILATVAEHVLSKDEEGKKTTYNTIKVHEREETLRTLEIKSRDQNINIINEILEANGVNILGMTMKKEEEYEDINIYKYVIFVNIEKPIDENALIDKITVVENIKNAIFTDKYEL